MRDDEIQNALTGRAPRRRPGRVFVCTICEQEAGYCHSCSCGFMICPACFAENAWGLTCNHVTWECPDCGGMRSF